MNKAIRAFACLLILGAVLCGCGANASVNSTNKKTIIATTYAAYDWTKNIISGTNTFELKYLVDSNVDLHSYQPTSDDIVAYKNADMVICIGGESEEWLEDLGLDPKKVLSLMDTVEKKEEELKEGMQGEEEGESGEETEEEGPEYDEHIWLSVKNAANCVSAISAALENVDGNNKNAYIKNANDYIEKLNQLDKEYADGVSKAKTKTLVFADRFPFRYMVDDYGLDYYAAFIGCSAETEASFETIAFLAKKVNELGLNHVCVIGQNHDIANAIISSSGREDVRIIEFDSMQSISNKEADSISYLDVMKENEIKLELALDEG